MSDVSFDPLRYRQGGFDYASNLAQIGTNRAAGNQLAAGNYGGAAGTLFQSGNIDGGRQLLADQASQAATARTTQTANNAQRLQATLRAAQALKSVRSQRGDVAAAFDEMAPALAVATGSSPQELAAIRSQIASNPAFLDQIEAATAEQMKYELRAGNNGDTVSVGINSQTGETRSRLAYAAPQSPEATQFGVINPPARQLPVGQVTEYQAGTSTGDSVLPGQQPIPQGPVPAQTGPAISSSPLWERQKQQESGGEQFTRNGQVLTSPKGAFGVAQLMPGTAADMAQQMGVTVEDLRRDPALNEAAGQRYQQQQLEKYGGNQALALAAYNAGPGKVDEWIQRFGDPRTGEITTEEFVSRIPYAETKDYVQNITQGQYGQGDNEGSAGQQSSGLEQLGGGYTLQRMQTPADERALRNEARADRTEARQGRTEERVIRNEERAIAQTENTENRQDRRYVTQEQQRLNTEFNKIPVVQRFRNTEAEYADVRSLARGRGGVNSVALTYAIMKMAAGDGSVVRESEFDLVGRAAGIPEGTIALMQRAANGDALTANQRSQIESVANTLYQTRRTEYNREAANFRRFAGEVGANPDRVAPVAWGDRQPANSQRRRPNTNTGVVPFDLSPGQLRTWQGMAANGGDPEAPRGDPRNPIPLNSDPNRMSRSWQNIPSGAYFYHPDGSIKRKP